MRCLNFGGSLNFWGAEIVPPTHASAVNEKTKAIIFNNPNNPLGKVYNREEIEMIAELCKKHNVLIISDDVYEHMVS